MSIEVFDDLDMQPLAEKLLLARRRLGLTQRQVAWAADMNPTHYTELECGKTSGLRANTLYKLCQVLGVSADVLLGLANTDTWRGERVSG